MKLALRTTFYRIFMYSVNNLKNRSSNFFLLFCSWNGEITEEELGMRRVIESRTQEEEEEEKRRGIDELMS